MARRPKSAAAVDVPRVTTTSTVDDLPAHRQPPPAPVVGPIDRAHALDLLRQMIRIRRFEEKCVELYSASAIRGFLHLCIGEEAIPVGVLGAVGPADAVVSTYREHGHALTRGLSMNSVLAEMYGKASGCSRGRGGSMHLFDRSTRFYGGNAIVAAGLPLAAGLALADRMQGKDGVTVCFFGEGAVAEGEFHESANLSALWQLPLLFCCENNLYAMGTALALSESETDLAVKAASYEIPSWTVDGMDVLAVERATRHAVTAIRNGGGPVFLELRTYRFRAHSMYDPERYRSKAEVETWKHRDPIRVLTDRLAADGGIGAQELAAEVEAIETAVAAEIAAAVAAAEAGPLEPVEELTRFVYSDRSPT
jgi:pyruvate dehydrogenase E1 component subunit alpha